MRRRWRAAGRVCRYVLSTPSGAFATAVLALWILTAVVSLLWTPVPVNESDGYHVWMPPSSRHWLGTDGSGFDVFSWLMAGSAVDLLIVVLVVLVAAIEGGVLSLAMIMSSARVGDMVVVAVDAMISIPVILLALLLSVPWGGSIAVVVVACGVGYGLNFARVIRPVAGSVARSLYVEAGTVAGGSRWRAWRSHILPHCLPTALVQLSLAAGTSILAESGLTYLGVGVPAGTPSWGRSLAMSAQMMSVRPLTVLWPGVVVTLVVAACGMFGDALRDAIDPMVNEGLRVDDGGDARDRPVLRSGPVRRDRSVRLDGRSGRPSGRCDGEGTEEPSSPAWDSALSPASGEDG